MFLTLFSHAGNIVPQMYRLFSFRNTSTWNKSSNAVDDAISVHIHGLSPVLYFVVFLFFINASSLTHLFTFNENVTLVFVQHVYSVGTFRWSTRYCYVRHQSIRMVRYFPVKLTGKSAEINLSEMNIHVLT